MRVRTKAFTLVELLVVLAIFAIIVILVITNITGKRQPTPEDLFEIAPTTSSQ